MLIAEQFIELWRSSPHVPEYKTWKKQLCETFAFLWNSLSAEEQTKVDAVLAPTSVRRNCCRLHQSGDAKDVGDLPCVVFGEDLEKLPKPVCKYLAAFDLLKLPERVVILTNAAKALALLGTEKDKTKPDVSENLHKAFAQLNVRDQDMWCNYFKDFHPEYATLRANGFATGEIVVPIACTNSHDYPMTLPVEAMGCGAQGPAYHFGSGTARGNNLPKTDTRPATQLECVAYFTAKWMNKV